MKRRRSIFAVHRGMALMMVMMVMAAASVMAFAILSSATIQMQVSANSGRASCADYLAESGINVATYYLMNPEKAPNLNGNGYWGGGTIVPNSGINDRITITVARIGAASGGKYNITSVGSTTTATGTSVSRTTYVTVRVNSCFQVPRAATFAGGVTIPAQMNVTGGVRVNGSLRVQTSGSITGGAWAKSYTAGGGSVDSLTLYQANYTLTVPSSTNIRDYSTYTYNGRNYSATLVSSTIQNVTLGPTASNPAGIYHRWGNLRLNGNVTINGTLIVHSGQLQVYGAANSVHQTISGFPAVVADQGLQMRDKDQQFTATGLVYLGRGIATYGDTKNGSITINGGLVMHTTSIDSNYKGTITINYVKANVNVPDLSTVGTMPRDVTVLAWD